MSRASILLDIEQYDRSLADLDHALLLNPENPEAHYGRASIMATCPVARIRDGKAAVAAATRACELSKWETPRYLIALAAAYAEISNFVEAIKWQKKAISLVRPSDPDRTEYQENLDLLVSGKPLRYGPDS